MNEIRLLALPGDGVGPEVTAESLRVLDWFRDRRKLGVSVTERKFGRASWQEYGSLMPDETWDAIHDADAILFGATHSMDLGDVPEEERKKGSLLRVRKSLDLFANLRPIKAQPALGAATPLKPEVVAGVDLVIVRELTAGMYFGTPRGVEILADGTRRGVNTHSYTEHEIARVARASFQLARGRKNHLTSVAKDNVMEAGALWREVVNEVHAAEFPDVRLDHIIADNFALQIVRRPRTFDVVVTDNLFGDIFSDLAGSVLGSLGMLPSASLSAVDANGKRHALYEPVHGAAPDIAGQGIANPLGSILSVVLMLRESFGLPAEAARLDSAVAEALALGARTPDIAGPGEEAGTARAMGDAVIAALDRSLARA